jgi:hypothetical protein
VLVHGPRLAGGQVGHLARAALAAPWRQRLEEPGVDECAHVVQHRRRVRAEPLGDLLVGQLLVEAQAQDPQAHRRRERLGLGLGGGAALGPAAGRRLVLRCVHRPQPNRLTFPNHSATLCP